MLIPKQILQRLPKALTRLKEGNTSDSLLNEILQIKLSLSSGKEITSILIYIHIYIYIYIYIYI